MDPEGIRNGSKTNDRIINTNNNIGKIEDINSEIIEQYEIINE